MEGKYFDLVLCNCGTVNHLFIAPVWSDLTEGDTVITEPWSCNNAMHGNNHATVIKALTTIQSNDDYDFIMAMASAGNMLPLRRIKSKVTYSNMDYSDYDDDCGVNGAEVSE